MNKTFGFEKVRNAISARPGLVTTAAMFGIGLAITFVVGTVVGAFEQSHVAHALGSSTICPPPCTRR
jgi:hypothetical protein